MLSLAGRVLFTAGVIVAVQWVVISRPDASKWLLLAVLGLPALFASHALTRALTMTTVDQSSAPGRPTMNRPQAARQVPLTRAQRLAQDAVKAGMPKRASTHLELTSNGSINERVYDQQIPR